MTHAVQQLLAAGKTAREAVSMGLIEPKPPARARRSEDNQVISRGELPQAFARAAISWQASPL
jgi:hypothetical protein